MNTIIESPGTGPPEPHSIKAVLEPRIGAELDPRSTPIPRPNENLKFQSPYKGWIVKREGTPSDSSTETLSESPTKRPNRYGRY